MHNLLEWPRPITALEDTEMSATADVKPTRRFSVEIQEFSNGCVRVSVCVRRACGEEIQLLSEEPVPSMGEAVEILSDRLGMTDAQIIAL